MRHHSRMIAVLTTLAAAAVAASASAGQPATGAARPLAAGGDIGLTRAASSPALRNAVALVRSKGYTPEDTRQYKPWATLRVLVASATGSATGHNKRAFFFVGRRYIGTATDDARGYLDYVGQTSTRVRLRFGVYGKGSADCCPTSKKVVRFLWNGKRLVPLDRIP